MPEEPLEAPDNFGRLPQRNPRDCRREDRERFRSSLVMARLSAVVIIPGTIVGGLLALSGRINFATGLAIAGAAWLVGVGALWFGARSSRAGRR